MIGYDVEVTLMTATPEGRTRLSHVGVELARAGALEAVVAAMGSPASVEDAIEDSRMTGESIELVVAVLARGLDRALVGDAGLPGDAVSGLRELRRRVEAHAADGVAVRAFLRVT